MIRDKALKWIMNLVMLLAVLLPVSWLCENACAQENLQGVGISILGDSISTYDGISNDASANATIGINKPYYLEGQYGMQSFDTWWQQAIDALGSELVVNNSWSGSPVWVAFTETASAGYGSRCVNLHSDAGRSPEVIAVYLGTNDFLYACRYNPNMLGTADAIHYDRLIIDVGDGTFTYASPTTTCEAYAVMLHKIKNQYPQAEVYCFTLLPWREPNYYTGASSVLQTSGFNTQIRALAEHFGCTIVDLENCGITKYPEGFDPYFVDYMVHPNEAGMEQIAEAFVSAVLGRGVELYDVQIQSPNVKLLADAPRTVISGNAYVLQITEAETAREIAVTITMNGEDVTASCYADGIVSIPAVTGDVQIEIVENSHNYLWRFEDGQLVNEPRWENTANSASLRLGSAVNGVFCSAQYALADSVELLHSRNWAVEWKGVGQGVAAFTPQSNFVINENYIYWDQSSRLFALGMCDGNCFHNYGIVLPADIDLTREHIYRLENHVYSYGGNMVYLYVDGVEIGPLNSYFVNYTAQGVRDNWISGKDFVFSYLGAEAIPMNGMSMEYLQVWEDDAPGTYCAHEEIIDVGVEPGCLESGLTSGSHCALCTLTLIPQEVIPPTGHILESLPAVEPGCEEAGLTAGMHCVACGEVMLEQEEVDPVGHTETFIEAAEPTCTESGLKQGARCSVCREVLYAEEIIPATGHALSFGQEVYELEAGGDELLVEAEFGCGHDVPLLFFASEELDVEPAGAASASLRGKSCGIAALTAETGDEAKTQTHCRVIVHAAQKLTLPPDMKDVAEEAFMGLSAQEIVLGKNVRSIAPRAFADCRELRLVQLPEGVNIANDAFSGCDKLTILCREEDTGHVYAREHDIPYIFLP